MEVGLFTFVENTPLASTGEAISPQQRVANLLEEIELAEQVGLDVFGIGEHHRPEYLASAPSVLLAAAAARTERIRLTSAVSVLSSDDPVRVFQRFATLDLISGGRAEIIAGRGSFTESFPLFGYDLADYDALFSEKLDLLMELTRSERVTWPGGHRPAIDDLGVYPRPAQDPLPVWVAVGGTPRSFIRAGALGAPLAIASIGGYPEQFAPLVELYREAARQSGHASIETLPISINAHGFLADDSQRASDLAFPAFKHTMDRIGRERGWQPMGRAQFEASRQLRGANFVGSPQEVIDKVLFQHEHFQHDRFLLQLTVGSLPHRDVLRAIELLGTEVAPVLRRETAKGAA